MGKGHFVCGNKDCSHMDDLHSFEVNFAYVEHGEKKNALVKLRLCPSCAFKLHYKKIKAWEKELSRKKVRSRSAKKRARLYRTLHRLPVCVVCSMLVCLLLRIW